MIKITEKQKQDCLETVKDLVSFPSVCSEQTGNMPFGKAIDDCLTYSLDYCESIGMTVFKDPNGYYGYADYGSGEEMIGIVGHLDVVPEGDHDLWDTDPFVGIVKGEKLYARGSSDDKGPTAASLHGLKAVIDSGVEFKKRVRYIFSTDEESSFRCLAAYRENEELPTASLVPDGSFPFTYGEKGLFNIKIYGPGSDDLLVQGGDAFNVVPSKAKLTSKNWNEVLNQLSENNQEAAQTSEDTITVSGKAAHASVNHLGNNAISQLAVALAPYTDHPMIKFIDQEIGLDFHATDLIGDIEDDLSGKVAFNLGMLEISEDKSELWIDIRYPFATDYNDMYEKITSALDTYEFTMNIHDEWDSYLVPLDTPFLQTVLSTYQELTGDMTKPGISTGATLARVLPNAIAFGTKGSKTKNSTAHQANEYVDINDLFAGMSIYANVLEKFVTSSSSLLE